MNPKTKKTITWIVVYLVSLIILGGGLAQAAAVKKVAEDMTRVGVGDYYRGLGVLKICLVGLYLYPKTFRLGFLLLCCFFGGAMATQLSHHENVMGPAIPLTLLWIATFLRDRSVFFQMKPSPIPSSIPKKQISSTAGMDLLSRSGIWLNRILLFAISVLFIAISTGFIIDPIGHASQRGITLDSNDAISVARASFGAFPIAFALITLSCLFFSKWRLMGLYSAAVIITVVTATRVQGIIVEGATPFTSRLLVNEIIIMALLIAGIFLELRRQRLYEIADNSKTSFNHE